jgi:hypothetical protein
VSIPTLNPVRRRLSFAALCLAWLCANGAIWNAVQVVAWAKMINDYSRVMPLPRAIQVTFDGSAPCKLCLLTAHAREATREPLPQEAALGTADKLILSYQPAAAFVLVRPEPVWPAIGDITGSTRPEAVPVRPPRV